MKNLLNQIYDIQEFVGKVDISKNLSEWTKKQFGDIKKVERQKIISIRNRFTYEHTIFNALRAKRPDNTKMPPNTNSFNAQCIFCNPLETTPSDPFGRIIGKYCVTASNIAKFDKYHSLIVFNEHNPLKLKQAWLIDYFDVCDKWFEAVEKYNNCALYNYIIWNSLWRSGASIIHGHIQIIASELKYAKVALLDDGISKYEKMWKGSKYFDDLIEIHKQFGLEITYNKDHILFYLSPIKEKEIVIISDDTKLRRIGKTIYKTLEFLKYLNVQSFNLIAYQIKNKYIVRIVDRGALNIKHSDYGAAEVYCLAIVQSDPFEMAERWKNLNEKD